MNQSTGVNHKLAKAYDIVAPSSVDYSAYDQLLVAYGKVVAWDPSPRCSKDPCLPFPLIAIDIDYTIGIELRGIHVFEIELPDSYWPSTEPVVTNQDVLVTFYETPPDEGGFLCDDRRPCDKRPAVLLRGIELYRPYRWGVD